MNTKDEKTNSILARVLSQEANIKDILYFSEWYNSSEENKKEFQLLKSYWIVKEESKFDIESELALEKLENKLKKRKSLLTNHGKLLIAASILFLISGISILFFNIDPSTQYLNYTSETGVSHIELPDGTIVHLNKNSKLRYPDSYGKKYRIVELDGEAYFDVNKAKSEFRVKLGDAQIKVFGTKFNVHAYSKNNFITTTLEEGAIGFMNHSHEIRLKPNEQLIYNKINDEFSINQVETSISTSWKDGIYKFVTKSMEELCSDLEKIYRVKINLDSKYKKIEMSGSFEYTLKIEEVLDILKRSLPYNCQIKDTIITIY